jgi:rod shape-determining protein MreD
MRGFALLLLSFLLLAFESPLLHQMTVSRYAPDVALIAVVYVGLSTPFVRGMGTVLGIGLLRDAFTTATPIGLYMEIAVIVFLICQRLSRRLAVRGPVGAMFVVFGFSLLAALIEIVLSVIFVRTFTQGQSGPGPILVAMVPQALITAPFAAVLFWVFDRIDRLTTRSQDSVFT